MMWSEVTPVLRFTGRRSRSLYTAFFLSRVTKKNGFSPEGLEPGITDETLVKDHDGTFGQFHGMGDAAFMGFGVGDGCESRNMPVVVQQGMHFYSAFGLPERGPGKELKAELYGSGVQAEQLGFETEFVLLS
jgi:hypothetical protein